MKPIEKRIRRLETFHKPSCSGPTYLWHEFLLLRALSLNIPRVWSDLDAMPKFLQDVWLKNLEARRELSIGLRESGFIEEHLRARAAREA